MKVMHIEAGRHLFGGAQQVAYLVNGLVKLNVDNIVVCPPNAELINEFDDSSVTLLPTKMKGDIDVGMVFRLRQIIQQHKPDLVHVHSRRGADLFALWAAKLCGVKVILSRRVDNTEPSWFARYKYNAYDSVVTISEGIRQVLLDEGVNPNHVQTILSAVDIGKFQRPQNREWLNDEFGLRNEDFVIGMLAQLIERKGHKVLFEAIPKILEQVSHAKILIFGKGPLESELKSFVASSDFQQSVIFAGFRTDIAKILANFDLLVHPAFTEGLGVSLLQASCSGVPIVASAVGGIPEAVADGENGLLIEPKDPRALADAVCRLATDETLREKMSINAKQRIQRLFSTEVMVQKNYDNYRRVLAS